MRHMQGRRAACCGLRTSPSMKNLSPQTPHSIAASHLRLWDHMQEVEDAALAKHRYRPLNRLHKATRDWSSYLAPAPPKCSTFLWRYSSPPARCHPCHHCSKQMEGNAGVGGAWAAMGSRLLGCPEPQTMPLGSFPRKGAWSASVSTWLTYTGMRKCRPSAPDDLSTESSGR